MGHVQTKLAAWSWAKEQDQEDDDTPRWVPLMAVDDFRPYRHPSDSVEDPPAPPNTKSVSLASSYKHSGPQSPRMSDFLEEEGDDLFETGFKATLSRPVEEHPSGDEYIEIPTQKSRHHSSIPVPGALARPLSNLTDEEDHFQTHRDSVDLTRRKLAEHKMNHQLMSTSRFFRSHTVQVRFKVSPAHLDGPHEGRGMESLGRPVANHGCFASRAGAVPAGTSSEPRRER